MTPSIGRIVHYVNGQGVHRAAMITVVWNSTMVDLQTFVPLNEPGLPYHTSVTQDEGGLQANHWHWPEYVA